MSKPITVSLESFETEVIEASSHRAVIVDFWAEWCTPCLVIAPLLETIANEYDQELIVAKLEVDAGDGENMKLAGKYQVRGFPTIIFFKNGQEVDRFSGAKSQSEIIAFIDKNL
jgi:putative thioredoxin